jgi:hypothetical protein
MSRSGYSEDCGDAEQWQIALWRGAVTRAIKGKRGQAFLQELVDSLDAMPEKRLISNDLIREGDVCAIGSVGVKRGVALEGLDVDDYLSLAKIFGVAPALVQEIEWENDEGGLQDDPEKRWQRMRDWAARHIKATEST